MYNNQNTIVTYPQPNFNQPAVVRDIKQKYTVSIVNRKPFSIIDSEIDVTSNLNTIGIIGVVCNQMQQMVTALVYNQNQQRPQQHFMQPQGYQQPPLRFSVYLNTATSVLGFIEENVSGGLEMQAGMSGVTRMYGYNMQEQPVSVITVRELIELLLSIKGDSDERYKKRY